jgi:hypothetical protein
MVPGTENGLSALLLRVVTPREFACGTNVSEKHTVTIFRADLTVIRREKRIFPRGGAEVESPLLVYVFSGDLDPLAVVCTVRSVKSSRKGR